jgi:hypothetical protein
MTTNIDAVVEKIRGMEAALMPDEVLNIYCETADRPMRLGSLQLTDSTIVLAHGVDDNNVSTCLVSTSFALQLALTPRPEAGKFNGIAPLSIGDFGSL